MLILCSQFLPFFVHLANSYSPLKRQLKCHLLCKNFFHSPTSVPSSKACFEPCVASNMAVGLHIGSLPQSVSPLSLRNGLLTSLIPVSSTEITYRRHSHHACWTKVLATDFHVNNCYVSLQSSEVGIPLPLLFMRILKLRELIDAPKTRGSKWQPRSSDARY